MSEEISDKAKRIMEDIKKALKDIEDTEKELATTRRLYNNIEMEMSDARESSDSN